MAGGGGNGCDQLQGDFHPTPCSRRSTSPLNVSVSYSVLEWHPGFISVTVIKYPYERNFGEKIFILSHSSKFWPVIGGSWNCHNTSRRLEQRDVNVCLPTAQLTLSTLIWSRMWAQGMVLLTVGWTFYPTSPYEDKSPQRYPHVSLIFKNKKKKVPREDSVFRDCIRLTDVNSTCQSKETRCKSRHLPSSTIKYSHQRSFQAVKVNSADLENP